MRLLRKDGCNRYLVAYPCFRDVYPTSSREVTLGGYHRYSEEASTRIIECDAMVAGGGQGQEPPFNYAYYTWGPTGISTQGMSKILHDEGNEPNWANSLILQTSLETANLDRIQVDESAGYIFVLATTAQFRNHELRRYPLAPSGTSDYTVLIQDTDLINGLLAGGLSLDRTNQRLFVLSGPASFGSGLIAEYTYDGTYVQTITSHSGGFTFLSGCGYDGQEYIYYKVGLVIGDNYLWRVSVNTLSKEQLILDNVSNNPEVYVANANKGSLVTINYGSRDIRVNTIPTLGSYTTIANGGAVGSVGMTMDWRGENVYFPASFLGRKPITGGSTEVVASAGSGAPIVSIDLGVGV